MFNEMKYVYAVYEEKSFSKAAKKLFVTQPALSNMVKKAESEIGVPIFDRSTIPLTVTKEGMYYIQAIEKILFIKRNTDSYFSDLSELNTGSLTLGGASYFCSFVFPALIGRFSRKYPGIAIDLMEDRVSDLRKGLIDESIDIVLETAVAHNDPQITRFPWHDEMLVLAIPTGFPINDRLKPFKLSREDIVSGRFMDSTVPYVPLNLLKDTPFVTMKKGNDLYLRGQQICKNAGFEMKVAMTFDQVLTAMNVAAQGMGAFLTRADLVRCLSDGTNLTYYKLGDPLARRMVFFAIKKDRYISAAMREFLRLAGVNIPEKE